MILNNLQSNAVYKAMLALNQANMLIDAWSGPTRVYQLSSGVVHVEDMLKSENATKPKKISQKLMD